MYDCILMYISHELFADMASLPHTTRLLLHITYYIDHIHNIIFVLL